MLLKPKTTVDAEHSPGDWQRASIVSYTDKGFYVRFKNDGFVCHVPRVRHGGVIVTNIARRPEKPFESELE
jgi:hypothetical protein